jgi:hypothetical protein
MLLTFGLMGAGALGLAVTPTYAQIGLWAPGLVVAFRLLQGLAAGGDVGPTSAYLAEAGVAHARGARIALQYAAMRGGALLGGLVGLACAVLLPREVLDAVGWRLAFALGAMIAPFAFYFRRQLEETLHLPETFAGAIVRLDPADYVLSLLGVFGGLSVIGLCDFFYTFSSVWLHAPQPAAYGVTIFVCAVQLGSAVIAGRLVDRFGPDRIMAAPWALGLVLSYPLFSWVASGGGVLALVISGAIIAALGQTGGTAALIRFVNTTPKRARSGLIGIGYGLAVAAAFGVGPPLVAQMITKTGDQRWLAIAFASAFLVALASLGLRRLAQARTAAAAR